MAWDKEDDDDSGSVLLGATVRPKGLDFDREKRTCTPCSFVRCSHTLFEDSDFAPLCLRQLIERRIATAAASRPDISQPTRAPYVVGDSLPTVLRSPSTCANSPLLECSWLRIFVHRRTAWCCLLTACQQTTRQAGGHRFNGHLGQTGRRGKDESPRRQEGSRPHGRRSLSKCHALLLRPFVGTSLGWPTPCRVAHSGDGCTHSWSVQTVTDVCFHPTTPLLASCSKDMSIKFFDYSKTHAKRSVKFIQVTGHATHTIALSSTLTFCYFHTGCGPTSINRLPPVGYRSMRQPQRAQTLFFFLRTWAD